ncbi:MAG: TonB-dependent receptor, partial [Bryobacteraceae bacterium]|nr:TonB-dependent receptor [Bryobacteraceae bacterium]
LYEFIRNSDLDANTFFANRAGTKLPHFERSQFGGSLTGPVLFPKLYRGKDKTFFLFSYEGLRQGTQSEVTTTVPTALQRTGDFSQTFNSSCQQVVIYNPSSTTASGSGYTRSAFSGNVIPSQQIDAVAAKIVNYYPLPNQAGTACTGANNYFGAGVSKLNIDTIDAKVDEVINANNRLFVRYSRRNMLQPPVYLFPTAQQIAEGGSSQPQVSNSAAIDYSFAPNQNLVIEVPFGFSRTVINFVPISAGFNPSTQLGFPSYIASNADHLLFPGIAPSNYYTLGDAGQGSTRHGAFDIFTIGANVTRVQGSHVLKFGATGWLLQANDAESGSSTGNYTFTQALTQGPNPNAATSTAGNSIASMMLGLGSGSMIIDSKNAATTSHYYGAYVQDDWRVRSRLTVNLGLRYDLEIPRTERHNKMETFNPTVASPLAITTGLTSMTGGVVFSGANGATRRQFNPQWKNFGPRLGFSYELNSNTQIRGAYGVYFGPSLRAAGATIGNEGFSAVTTYTGSANGLTPSVYLSNPYPNGLNTPVGSTQGLLTGIGSSFENPITGDNKVGYTQNWDLDIQRQLPFNVLVDASYVGSHGVHLNKAGENDWNGNQLSTAALSLGTALQQSVANPFYGIITTGAEASATIPKSYLVAPFPQFTAVDFLFPTGGFEVYHSFQLKVNKRLSHNLSALVAFTGQKQIDDYSIISNVGNNAGGIQNIYNPAGERAVSSNDISRSVVVSAVYNLPIGRGQAFGANWSRPLDLALGGWQINAITSQADGFPLPVSTQNTSQSGNNVLRPNLTGTSPVVAGLVKSKLNGYINSAAFSQPAAFTFGNAPRTLSNVRAPGNHDIDFSMFKNFHATENVNV